MPTPPYVSELHQQHQIVIKRQSRVYSMGLPKGRTEEVCVKHAAHSLSPRKHLTLAIFIILGATEFITGTNWGLYIIALPIVIPLSQAVGGNTVLAISAVLSAGVFGSHICFYSDATIISSAACGCDNFEHGLSQMPYGFLGAGIAMILFTVAGFVMT